MTQPVEIGVYRLVAGAVMPAKAHPTDAGWDLASTEDRFLLGPGRRKAVRTGLVLDVPPGYEVQIRSRSGLANKHGVMVLNSPGTVDAGYVGEIVAILMNLGEEPIWIEPGMRIAQAVVAPVLPSTMVERAERPAGGARGVNGLGSTG